MKHPYEDAPAYRRWSRSVARVPVHEVDPVVSLPFKITPQDRIVTAGSCFAQHIARHLRERGFHYLETEPAHPLLSPEIARSFGYGLYSARYGNVYTARQLLQLLRRAYGRFQPMEDVWLQDDRYYDPFRPGIQPEGFASAEEYVADRKQHFAAVRSAFEAMDYFVFTLGLTECWLSQGDGAAFPVCPGTVAGEFDQRRHLFVNDGVEEVVDAMRQFIQELRQVNARVKIIVTVSPVPLVATAEDKHALVATAYSKSVLRVAAEMLTRLPEVFYFPAYEIVTGTFVRGGYFADDLRSIREEGVQHVMEVFFRHATTEGHESQQTVVSQAQHEEHTKKMRSFMDTMCEEAALDTGHPVSREPSG